MVRIPVFHYHGPGSIPGWGTEILQATQCRQKKKKKKEKASQVIPVNSQG